MRKLLLLVHRWLGLTAGAVFGVAALTGGVLVYQEELNALMLGPREGSTPGIVDASILEASIERERPGSRILRVDWPTNETKVFRITVSGGQQAQTLELDPGSGNVLPARRLHIVLIGLRRLHASLLLGPIGRLIVTSATIASIISLLAGLYLWWPGIRRLARGFRIRVGRGLYPLTFDVHQTSGVIALPLLLVMSASGILMDFPTLRTLVEGRRNVASWAALESQSSAGPEARDIDLSTAVRIALNEANTAPMRIEFPLKANGVVDVKTQRPATRLALDRRTGAVIARQSVLYDTDVNDRLHFGRVGGEIGRVLYAASCFIGAGLLVTGFLMWKMRKPAAGR